MALFISGKDQLPLVLDHIKFVGQYTGLELNVDKTLAFYHKQDMETQVAGVRIRSVPVKYLGVYLGKGDLSKLNFEKPLKAACLKIQAWNKRHLSLPARITVHSFLAYLCMSLILSG